MVRTRDVVLTRPAAPPPGHPGRFATVDGVRAYYRVNGRGPALVLLHGLGSSHLTWAAVDSAFDERFTVYVVHLPGFGYSDKLATYTSARQEADFVDHLLAGLGVERATVIGHSLGGDVALWLATQHPSRLSGLVLVDAAEVGEAAAVFKLAATPILGDGRPVDGRGTTTRPRSRSWIPRTLSPVCSANSAYVRPASRRWRFTRSPNGPGRVHSSPPT